MKTQLSLSPPTCLLGQFHFPGNETDRIREVFRLAGDVPLPLVSSRALRVYHDYLTARLSFPFQALYAESKPPIRHLVRYISVSALREVAGRPSQGILCRIEGSGLLRELPLVEIGVRDDNPNHRLIDDYSYWFLNWR